MKNQGAQVQPFEAQATFIAYTPFGEEARRVRFLLCKPTIVILNSIYYCILINLKKLLKSKLKITDVDEKLQFNFFDSNRWKMLKLRMFRIIACRSLEKTKR